MKVPKFIAVIFLMALISACGGEDGEQGPPGADGPAGEAGAQGEEGESGAAGAQGAAGAAGAQGAEGEQGIQGEEGADGVSCTVVDNGDGTKTITCGEAVVTVEDGSPGDAGDDCTVVDNDDGTLTITCGDESVVVRLPDDGTTADPTVNYDAVHNPAAPEFNTDCVSCHAGRIDEGSLDDAVPGFHALKLAMDSIYSTDVVNERCVYCHSAVDSVTGSAGNLRRQVDVALCASCHTGGAHTFYQ